MTHTGKKVASISWENENDVDGRRVLLTALDLLCKHDFTEGRKYRVSVRVEELESESWVRRSGW